MIFKYKTFRLSGLCLFILSSIFFVSVVRGADGSSVDTLGSDGIQSAEEQVQSGAQDVSGDQAYGMRAATASDPPKEAFNPSLEIPVPKNQEYMGASTLTVPITVPPGRNGIEPRLKLSYNSQQKNGWLGVGWTLDMGSIQRNTKWGVTYTKNDFVVTGEGGQSELVPRPEWGVNCFGARIEGAFTKYCYVPATNSWAATAKDGNRYVYGTTAATRQDDPYNSGKVFKWCLERIEDTNGNSLTISYTKNQGEIYPAKIEYTGNGTLQPNNSVNFILENRTDIIAGYGTEFRVTRASRLKSIQVFARVNGTPALVRTYDLTYVTSGDSGRSVLTRITRKGSNNISTLPPVSLVYTGMNSSGAIVAADPLQKVFVANMDINANKRLTIADFNGDGKADILLDEAGLSPTVFTANDSGSFDKLQFLLTTPKNGYLWASDYNGDGCADAAYWGYDNTTYIHVNYAQCTAEGTLTGFSPAAYPVSPSIRSGFPMFLDLNGDGRADIIVFTGTGTADVHMSRTDAAGSLISFDYYPNVAVNVRRTNADTYAGDFNGDGCGDFVAWHNNAVGVKESLKVHLARFNDQGVFQGFNIVTWTANITSSIETGGTTPNVHIADFNGDGKTDIVSYKDAGSVHVNLSTGTGFVSEVWSGVTVPYQQVTKLSRIGDFNGDGLPDIMAYKDNIDMWVNLSTGKGFNRVSWAGSLDAINGQHYLGDFNGDGRTDIVTNNYWNNGQPSVYYHLSRYPPTDLISQVKNGIGGVSTIAYTPSRYWANGELPFTVHNVSQIITTDGTGVTATETYSYAGGLYSHKDREFYGFRYVKKTDALGAVTETWFKQREPDGIPERYKGCIEAQIVSNASGYRHSSVANTFTARNIFNAAAVFPFLEMREDRRWQTNTVYRQTGTLFDYDQYGNETLRQFEGDLAVTGDERYEISQYGYDTSRWILNRPATISITDRAGTVRQHTFFAYDQRGNLITKRQWLNGLAEPTTTWTYNQYGLPITVTDPMNSMTTRDYDPTFTYVVKTTNPLGHVMKNTYSYLFGKPLTETSWHVATDTNPPTASFTFDVFGRRKTETDPDGGVTTYTYNSFGTVGSQNIKTQFSDGSWIQAYFDGLGRKTTVKRSAPEATKHILTKTTYNAGGLIARTSLPCFTKSTSASCLETQRWTVYTYDPFARPTKITHTDGTTTTMSYVPYRTTIIDQKGHKKVHEKDAHDRLARVEEHTATGALYGTTLYGYDTLGNLTDRVDALGNHTVSVYDTLSRKISETDPAMGYWTYQYDANGNLISRTDAKGQTVTFSYDPLNRIKQKVYPGNTRTFTYTYDETSSTHPVGRLTSVIDTGSPSSGTIRYSYDKKGRLTSSTRTIDGKTYTIGRTYDTMDRIASITYPNNEVISYVYDLAGNVSQVKNVSTVLAGYSLTNPAGQPGKITFGNGVSTTFTYYPENYRLKNILTSGTAGTFQNTTYVYDAKGNITTITDATPSARNQSFTYDHLHRLTSATGPYGSLTFTYNEIGNMMTNSRVGSYTYHATKPHAVIQAGTNTYSYDANGNMINGAGRVITWDADNMPRSVTSGGTTTSFLYDHENQRIKKTGLTNTLYIDKLYECINGTCSSSIFAGTRRIAKKTGTSLLYYHPDHLGSSSVITSQTGTKAEELAYYPYGETHIKTGTVDVAHKFTGQEEDAETGLYNYNARHYDPYLARFISPDPVDPKYNDPQSLNRYSYVLNNPLIYTDPSGNVPDMMGNEVETSTNAGRTTSLINLIVDIPQKIKQWRSSVEKDYERMVIQSYVNSGYTEEQGRQALHDEKGANTINNTVILLSGAAGAGKRSGRIGIAEGEGSGYNSILKKVDALDFSTPRNTAVFYSGSGQLSRAMAFAENNGCMTIEMTAGGRALLADPIFQSLSPAQQYTIWQKASTPFAQGASGKINLFIKGARPEGTYRTIEEKILRSNSTVYKYTYHY